MTKNEILTFLREKKSYLAEQYGVTSIGLFGSYARDDFDRYSDVDIAVMFDSNYLETHDVWDYFDTLKSLQNAIMQRFGLKSDIFDLDSASPLREQIAKDTIYV